jgi:hypothetical protein
MGSFPVAEARKTNKTSSANPPPERLLDPLSTAMGCAPAGRRSRDRAFVIQRGAIFFFDAEL